MSLKTTNMTNMAMLSAEKVIRDENLLKVVYFCLFYYHGFTFFISLMFIIGTHITRYEGSIYLLPTHLKILKPESVLSTNHKRQIPYLWVNIRMSLQITLQYLWELQQFLIF